MPQPVEPTKPSPQPGGGFPHEQKAGSAFPYSGHCWLSLQDVASLGHPTKCLPGWLARALQVYSDAKSLRYGHLMIMTDQDHDGSHIKGLIMNFFHHFYPSLLRVPGFLVEFITPIIKVRLLPPPGEVLQ